MKSKVKKKAQKKARRYKMSNGAFYDDLIKLIDMSLTHLQPYFAVADESYRDYLVYVDKYLVTNYSNVLVNQQLYGIYIDSFIPAHNKEFARIATAINSNYNPIQNYDMSEHETLSRTLADIDRSRTQSGNKSTDRTVSGSTTVKTDVDTAVINQQTLKRTDEQTVTTTPNNYSENTTETYNDITESESETYKNPESSSRTLTRSGNIGVTTSQQMIKSTFELENENKIIYYIANVFINELTTGVYDYD